MRRSSFILTCFFPFTSISFSRVYFSHLGTCMNYLRSFFYLHTSFLTLLFIRNQCKNFPFINYFIPEPNIKLLGSLFKITNQTLLSLSTMQYSTETQPSASLSQASSSHPSILPSTNTK